jgi:hypothetical protein
VYSLAERHIIRKSEFGFMAAGAADAAIARQNRVKKNCFTELFFSRDYFFGYFLFAAEHHETTKNQ